MKDVWQLLVYGGLGAVLFIPLIVSDSMFFPFITGKNFWFRIIVEITLAAWILLALYEPRFRPRFSWLIPGMAGLLVVMFVANLLGVHPEKSFWSNYERMDGYVTLIHFGAYFVVLGSVLSVRTISFFGRQTSSWYIFMVTALVAAVWVALTAFQQLAGLTENTRDGWRINGTLGNAAYMAIYMLFNVFVALWVLVQTKVTWGRVVAGALAVLFTFLLVQTGTRGTLIGFAGGTFVGALYIAIFNHQYPVVRKVALGLVIAVMAIVGTLYVYQDSTVVQESAILNRATAINLSELELRMEIWAMGLEGISERPVLGWGQGNFNYIFNEYYDPALSGRAEEWYDRGHNIFIDWLSNGGVLGLIAYLAIWVGLAYYMFVQPHRRGAPEYFTVTERGLLIGILAGYFIHNLVVFDNIVSYIFFAVVLALIHSRVQAAAPSTPRTVDPVVITNVITPVVLIGAALAIYLVNVPSMLAAQDIIDAYRSDNPAVRLEAFERAFARDGFALQEVTEQFVQQAVNLSGNQQIAPEIRQAFQTAAATRINNLLAYKPGDARVHVFATSFYRNVGDIEQAREQAALARQYSPEKPTIIIDQGYVEYQAGDLRAMRDFFQEAYDLNPDNYRAQMALATGLLATDAPEAEWRAVLGERASREFLTDRLAMIVAERTGNYALLREMFATAIERSPRNVQGWISLAFTEYRLGSSTAAIATLEETAERFPEVASATQCFIDNIAVGNEPNDGC